MLRHCVKMHAYFTRRFNEVAGMISGSMDVNFIVFKFITIHDHHSYETGTMRVSVVACIKTKC